jgi:hypothetical protein
MTDDKTKQGADRTRISLDEEYEVQYWTKELGVSREDLERAVASVGNSTDKVRELLGGHAKPTKNEEEAP